MSDKSSDKRIDEALAGQARVAGGAPKPVTEQGAQVAGRVAELAAAASRAATASVAGATTAAAPAVAIAPGVARETAGELARASQGTNQAAAVQAADTIKSNMERAMTTAEEMMSFGQGNIEAFVKASQIWTSGLQDLGRHMAQSAQAQFDGTMTAFKAMASVKSVHEVMELQSSTARSALEKAVQDGGKLTDASMKLAEQAIAPITARVTYVAERFGRVAA